MPGTELASPVQVQLDHVQQYRQQLTSELPRPYEVEPAEAKTERAKRRAALEKESQAANRDLAEISKKLEAERNKLQQLETQSQQTILTATDQALENLETKIAVSQKKVAALETQQREKQAAVQKVQSQIGAIDSEARAAEQNDSTAILINETTAEYLTAIDAITTGLKLLPQLYRRLGSSEASPALSSENEQALKHRAAVF